VSYPASSATHVRRPAFTWTTCLVAAALMAAGVMSMPTAMAASRPATSNVVESTSTPAPTIQLADEIIRRLRRLGINFNRARIPRPYDPDGEVC